MSDQNKLEKAIDGSEKLKKKLEVFSDILDDLASTEEKKKLLWKEVYENALVDRENAGMLFTDAWSRMGTGSTEHVTLGSTLTKYLERMSKSNEQILRLVEIISKAEEKNYRMEPDDIFSSIGES
jgi:H2-forming N5,N10-methylenetetrahydromethanopterin dehydrogenase-like enzyme